jgi:hypothetical protein
MASSVDIVNLALSRLGATANVASIDPPEDSAQAEQAAIFYPMARDTLLEMHPWNFATKRVSLAEIGTSPDGWEYSYALPSDYLRALAVLSPDVSSNELTQNYIIETATSGDLRLYTNVEQATLKYISKVTDTTKFSPLFTNTLSWLLAHYMAGSIIKGGEGIQVGRAMYQQAMQMFISASSKDSSARDFNPNKNHTPPWIADYDIQTGAATVFDADGRVIS